MTISTIELTSTHHTASTTSEPTPLSQELATGNLTLRQLLTIGQNGNICKPRNCPAQCRTTTLLCDTALFLNKTRNQTKLTHENDEHLLKLRVAWWAELRAHERNQQDTDSSNDETTNRTLADKTCEHDAMNNNTQNSFDLAADLLHHGRLSPLVLAKISHSDQLCDIGACTGSPCGFRVLTDETVLLYQVQWTDDNGMKMTHNTPSTEDITIMTSGWYAILECHSAQWRTDNPYPTDIQDILDNARKHYIWQL